MTAVRWAGDKLREAGEGVLNLVVGAALIAGVCGALLALTVGTAWVGIQVYELVKHDPKHVDPQTQEICWAQNGANGIEVVSGPRSYRPSNPRDAIEVPCTK